MGWRRSSTRIIAAALAESGKLELKASNCRFELARGPGIPTNIGNGEDEDDQGNTEGQDRILAPVPSDPIGIGSYAKGVVAKTGHGTALLA